MADLKALLAILGSRCVALWVHLRGDKAKQALFPRITMNTLKGIPIARSWMESRASLSTMVDRILAAKQQDARADVSELEEEIDELRKDHQRKVREQIQKCIDDHEPILCRLFAQGYRFLGVN